MYATSVAQAKLEEFIAGWQVDELGTKPAFTILKELLETNKNSLISFHARPGITCSLRAQVGLGQGAESPLYAMVDVIDDDPNQRWLSVCFYGDKITDPNSLGDFVPGGLLGEDAVCFDYDTDNVELLEYIKSRIKESYEACLKHAPA